MLPPDPFGRSRLPASFNRRDRVRLILEVRDALLEGRLPDRAAALFVGGALSGWLAEGGSLEKDFLKTSTTRGCKRTASVLARELENERTQEREDLSAC